jgi:drug/metabolite transporter (DMT)-like permease
LVSESANPWLVYGLLVAIGGTGGLGDIWIFNWAKSGNLWWLVLASLVWLSSLILFGLLLKWDSRTFSAAFMLATVFHALLVVVCDLIYFGGRLTRMEWAGIGFAVIAVILLELGHENHNESSAPPSIAAEVSSEEWRQ